MSDLNFEIVDLRWRRPGSGMEKAVRLLVPSPHFDGSGHVLSMMVGQCVEVPAFTGDYRRWLVDLAGQGSIGLTGVTRAAQLCTSALEFIDREVARRGAERYPFADDDRAYFRGLLDLFTRAGEALTAALQESAVKS